MALINRPKRNKPEEKTEYREFVEDGQGGSIDVTTASSGIDDEPTVGELCVALKERLAELIKPSMETHQILDALHALRIDIDAIEAAHHARCRELIDGE